ncbi:hypothetical protein C8Q79DRAFT_454964 [Trametes meyenii]|nr:hypothetical protein C8Q79DRAFT_454964 [Trametes meyenii]
MSLLFILPPEEWATGGEPMTKPQKKYLYNLVRPRGIYLNFFRKPEEQGRNPQRVTKAEAAILIAMLKDGVRPTRKYLNSLGRNTIPYEPPQHARYWRDCHGRPTDMQIIWVSLLAAQMSVTRPEIERGLVDITRGQVSLLIRCWREWKESTWVRQFSNKDWLWVRSVQLAKAELPLPGETLEEDVKGEQDEDAVELDEVTIAEAIWRELFVKQEGAVEENVMSNQEVIVKVEQF